MGEQNTAATILAVTNLVNTYGPQIISLIMEIRKSDGSIETIDVLKKAESQFQANIDQADNALGGKP
jgi:hypothetical protein